MFHAALEGSKICLSTFFNNVKSDLTVGDVDGDTYPEIMVGVSFGALVLNHDTTIATGFPKDTHSNVYGGLTCGDVDGDVEIGLGMNDNGSYSRVYIWDLPYPYHEECQDWPQYNHDAQHTGNFHYKPIVPQVALPTLTPWAILLLVLLLSPVLVQQRS